MKLFYLIKKDPNATKPKKQSSKLISNEHQTPPMAIFPADGEKMHETKMAWAWASCYSDLVTGGFRTYQPGKVTSCKLGNNQSGL
jgi:hypothetical protein